MEVIISILLVFLVIYIIPFLVYGLSTLVTKIEMPKGASPQQFMLSVFVSKFGTAIAFVLLFYYAKEVFADRLFLYVFLWWFMYALGEIGQVIQKTYSWKEAVAGVVSEVIYFPLSAIIVSKFL